MPQIDIAKVKGFLEVARELSPLIEETVWPLLKLALPQQGVTPAQLEDIAKHRKGYADMRADATRRAGG